MSFHRANPEWVPRHINGVSSVTVDPGTGASFGASEVVRLQLHSNALWAPAFSTLAASAHRARKVLEPVEPFAEGIFRVFDRVSSIGPDVYRSIVALWSAQNRVTRDDAGVPRAYFAIVEDGATVDYAVISANGEAQLSRGRYPSECAERAAFIAIHNAGRSRRPRAAGHLRQQANPDPSGSVLNPDRILKDSALANELIGVWTSPQSHLDWWLTANPYPILPNSSDPNRTASQPYQLTLSAARLIHQREAIRATYLADIMDFLWALNCSEALQKAEGDKFRIGINGFQYAPPDGPKAGASQAQLHANVVRAIFPLEFETFIDHQAPGGVAVCRNAPASTSGSVALLKANGASAEGRRALAMLTSRLLELIVAEGNSFNVLLAPGDRSSPDEVRAYVASRTLGTPYPLFLNEWAYAEIARAPVIDDPRYFYELSASQVQSLAAAHGDSSDWVSREKRAGQLRHVRKDLGERLVGALRMTTAPHHQLIRALQCLT